MEVHKKGVEVELGGLGLSTDTALSQAMYHNWYHSDAGMCCDLLTFSETRACSH